MSKAVEGEVEALVAAVHSSLLNTDRSWWNKGDMVADVTSCIYAHKLNRTVMVLILFVLVRELQDLGVEEEALEAWHRMQQGSILQLRSFSTGYFCYSFWHPSMGPHKSSCSRYARTKPGVVESHFQNLTQKLEEAKSGVLTQLSKQVHLHWSWKTLLQGWIIFSL